MDPPKKAILGMTGDLKRQNDFENFQRRCSNSIDLFMEQSNGLTEFLKKQDQIDGKFTLTCRDRIFQRFTEAIEICLCELEDLSHKYDFDFWIVDDLMNTIVGIQYLEITFGEEKLLWIEQFSNAMDFINKYISEKRDVERLFRQDIWESNVWAWEGKTQ